MPPSSEPSGGRQFARSDGRQKLSPLVGGGAHLTFEVAPEIVDQAQEWSPPVRFRFEKHENGMVTMWLQTIEGPRDDATTRPKER